MSNHGRHCKATIVTETDGKVSDSPSARELLGGTT